MTDLSPDAQSILEAGRDLDGAGDLEKARVRRALFAKIAAGGAVLAATSTAAAESGVIASGTTAAATTTAATGGGTFAAVATPLAKILIPLAIVTGGAAGGFVAWRAQRAMTPAPVVAPSVTTTPAVAAPPAAVVPAAPAIAPAIEPPAPASRPAHRARVAPAAHTEAAVAPVNHLAEETALLASANAELRRGDARRALALLDDYDRRYPAGVLREEVLATRVIARCQQSPDRAARRAAEAFLARHPASPLASRVRTSCE
jgi:hypothetical protein